MSDPRRMLVFLYDSLCSPPRPISRFGDLLVHILPDEGVSGHAGGTADVGRVRRGKDGWQRMLQYVGRNVTC